MSDILNAEILQNMLGEEIKVIYYPSVDSTNNQAKRLISGGNSNTLLIVSDEQTNGRGRQGKSFYSPAKSGIYMSFVFHPMADFSSVIASTTAASVAVCRAIEKLTDLTPEIKWVNDIYIGGKKVCGILCEAISDTKTQKICSVIIGIGVNISTADFPEDIENASCLKRDIERAVLIAEITRQLTGVINKDFGEFIDYYRTHSIIIGKEIEFIQNGVSTAAKALAIDGEGGLVVETDMKEIKTLRSGEISIRRRN